MRNVEKLQCCGGYEEVEKVREREKNVYCFFVRFLGEFKLSWRDRECGSVAIHLANTGCN